MLPYFFLLFISVVFPLIAYHLVSGISVSGDIGVVQKSNKMTILLFFFGLFILLALRDITVGRDIDTYKVIFYNCVNTSFENLSNMQWEVGYSVYNKIVSFIVTDYRFFLIITAIITLIPIYKLYSQEKQYSFLTIVLFLNMPCFLMIFSGLRQAIATSIGILAYMAIEKKKYIFSVLLILFAMTFHISAGCLFLFYPAFFFRIKSKHLFCIVPIMICVYLCRVPLLSALLAFLPGHYTQFYGEIQQTGAYGMMILFLIFCIFSFVILDESAMSKKDYFMRNVLLIATVFQFFVPIHGLIQRASYYFLIFVPISITRVVKAPKRYLKSISDFAVVVMAFFFSIYFFINASFSTDNLLDVFPYKFFWSGEGW